MKNHRLWPSASRRIVGRMEIRHGHVVRIQRSQLHRSIRNLGREGFRHVHVLKTPEEVDDVFRLERYLAHVDAMFARVFGPDAR